METKLFNFVCLGNICRSPMAEFVCKDILNKHHIKNIEVTSSGTAGYHDGEDMHSGTKTLLSSKHIDCNGFVSKRITKQLFDNSSFVIVMDNSNYQNVINMFGSHPKIIKMCDYCDLGYNQVPDPWYTGNFEEVYEILNNAITNFLIDKKII